MMEKIVGGFDEMHEETIGMFALMVVEPRHRARTQELVEEPAAVSPTAPVFHGYNIPGALVHA